MNESDDLKNLNDTLDIIYFKVLKNEMNINDCIGITHQDRHYKIIRDE